MWLLAENPLAWIPSSVSASSPLFAPSTVLIFVKTSSAVILALEPLSPVAPLGIVKSSVMVFVTLLYVLVTLALVPAAPVVVVPTMSGSVFNFLNYRKSLYV